MIDSHFHIFQRAMAPQSGILAAPFLQRDVLWEDYAAAIAGGGVEASVMVQVCDFVEPLPEAEWVASVAAQAGGPAAMVAYAQLEAPAAARQLESLGGLPLVTGIRRNTQAEPDPVFCAGPGFIAGARLVGQAGYVLDICAKAHQLPAVIRLASACPDTRIVLNHMGKPDLAAADNSAWLADMKRLGALANVSCKVSVVVHAELDPPLTRALAEPVVEGCIEAFGWDRVLFGSNWPVALAVVEYGRWVEMLDAILARENAGDTAKLFGRNARRIYRLP